MSNCCTLYGIIIIIVARFFFYFVAVFRRRQTTRGARTVTVLSAGALSCIILRRYFNPKPRFVFKTQPTDYFKNARFIITTVVM